MFADSDASLRGTVTCSSLRSVLAHIQASAWPADLVCVTGDLIQDDSAGAYANFRDLLSPLGLPIHCVPGNHDVRSLMRSALSNSPFHYCQALAIGNWLLIGIDTCTPNSAGGRISDAEFARLESQLTSTDAEHVMIFMHHPPIDMGSRWLDSVGLENAAAFLHLIAGHSRVRLAIFGHVHQSIDQMHSGVRIIGTPSTCRQFLPGSDDFAVDDNPPAYRRIELRADGGITEELFWVEQGAANV